MSNHLTTRLAPPIQPPELRRFSQLDQALVGLARALATSLGPAPAPSLPNPAGATPDGRAHLVAVEYLPPAELPDAEYPFFMNTGRQM